MATDSSHLLSDHDLVARAQSGDAVALDRLIAAMRPVVMRYCRSRLGTYAGGIDAADDVAQETCVAVLRMLPRYQRQGSPFQAFVYAIAANKVADMQRRYHRSAVLIEEVPDREEPSPTPEQHAMAAVHLTVARELLARLPSRTREVLLLRADGLSTEDIGAQLSMSANAVRVTQHRGLARLRQLIAESAEHRDLFADYGRSVA